MLKFVAGFVHVLLWLKVAVSPMLIGAFVGALTCVVRDEVSLPIIAICTGLGLIVGIVWAERTRRTIGLSNFHGRLIGHPEIDGASGMSDRKNSE